MEAQPSFADVSERGDGSASLVTWSDVAEGIACFPARLPSYTIKTMTVFGEFGGAAVEIEGSNDGVHWVSLRDSGGGEISLVGENIVTLGQHTLLVKPRIVGGLSVKLTFSLLALR